MNNENKFEYTGTDNLEVMAEAINYNNYLSSLVFRYCSDSNTVVDFGAGIGTFAEKLNSNSRNLIAVEPDEGQRARLSLKGIQNVGDIKELCDSTVDMVYSINVLEHIEDDRSAIADIYSKLKPSGVVFIYVPAFQLIFSPMDVKVGHYRRYRRADLNKKMRDSGFTILESRYADSLGFFASFVLKYFGNKDGGLNKNAVKVYDRILFPISRILDCILSPVVGKNLIIFAKK